MPSAFTLDTVVVIAANQVSANLAGGDSVILNLTTGIYFSLNRVGARIWSLIAEPRSVANILETLLAEYEVDSARCLADLQELLESLSEVKMIEVRSA